MWNAMYSLLFLVVTCPEEVCLDLYDLKFDFLNVCSGSKEGFQI